MGKPDQNTSRRRIDKSTIVFGIRPVMEMLESGQDLERVFIQKNLKGELIGELLKLLGPSGTPVSKVPIERLNKFTGKNHQGVVALVSPVKYFDLSELVTRTFEAGETPLILVLDRITDVGNFGAIARSADALGAHGIVIPTKNAAQINADSVKTSAGALGAIPVCRVEQLGAALDFLQQSGFYRVACSEKGKKPVYKLKLEGPCALVMGSEEDGISEEVLAHVDQSAFIPMTGKVASMNVSAAAAVFMYEVLKQRAK